MAEPLVEEWLCCMYSTWCICGRAHKMTLPFICYLVVISDEAALIQYWRWVTIPMYFTRDSCQLDCSWAASGLALSSLGATETLYTQNTAQQDSNVRCLQAIIWGRSSAATFNTFDVIKPLKKRHFKKKKWSGASLIICHFPACFFKRRTGKSHLKCKHIYAVWIS